MQTNNAFFQNKDCEYFPCHKGLDKEKFNCMFCYCPLYMLGDKCGGNYKILAGGIKDCSDCVLCHSPTAADYISAKFGLIKDAENNIRNRK